MFASQLSVDGLFKNILYLRRLSMEDVYSFCEFLKENGHISSFKTQEIFKGAVLKSEQQEESRRFLEGLKRGERNNTHVSYFLIDNRKQNKIIGKLGIQKTQFSYFFKEEGKTKKGYFDGWEYSILLDSHYQNKQLSKKAFLPFLKEMEKNNISSIAVKIDLSNEISLKASQQMGFKQFRLIQPLPISQDRAQQVISPAPPMWFGIGRTKEMIERLTPSLYPLQSRER